MTSRFALIDTSPVDMRNRGSINLGLEIVKNYYTPDVYGWKEKLPRQYDVILFNVFYPMNIINMISFLKKNDIECVKDKRHSVKIIIGGQGVSNIYGLPDFIADETYRGELDGDCIDKIQFNRQSVLSSDPVICNGKAVIEITD